MQYCPECHQTLMSKASHCVFCNASLLETKPPVSSLKLKNEIKPRDRIDYLDSQRILENRFIQDLGDDILFQVKPFPILVKSLLSKLWLPIFMGSLLPFVAPKLSGIAQFLLLLPLMISAWILINWFFQERLSIEGESYRIKGIKGNREGHLSEIKQVKLVKSFVKGSKSLPRYRVYLVFEPRRTFKVVDFYPVLFARDDQTAASSLAQKIKHRLNLDYIIDERSIWSPF